MAAKDLVLTAVQIAALQARLEAAALEGGDFSTPSQKNMELTSILYDMVYAVDPSGA